MPYHGGGSAYQEKSNTKSPQNSNIESALEWLFSGKRMAKLLDFFILNKQTDYSETDIARNALVSKKTAYRQIKKLEGIGIIIYTRKVGMAKMYKFDSNSDISEIIVNFHAKVIEKK